MNRAKRNNFITQKVMSLVFRPSKGLDEQRPGWTFLEGSRVELVCTNSPYTGIHQFLFNKTVIFSCTSSICLTLNNDNGSFLFESEIQTFNDTGKFTWIIERMKMTYNDLMFECYDGLNYNSIKAIVHESSESSTQNLLRITLCISMPVVCIAMLLSFIIGIRIRNKFLTCLPNTVSKNGDNSAIETDGMLKPVTIHFIKNKLIVCEKLLDVRKT